MIGLRLGLGLRNRRGSPPIILPPPAHDYLTDSTGATLTDSGGFPLWVAGAVNNLTNSAGQPLGDSTGAQLWS